MSFQKPDHSYQIVSKGTCEIGKEHFRFYDVAHLSQSQRLLELGQSFVAEDMKLRSLDFTGLCSAFLYHNSEAFMSHGTQRDQEVYCLAGDEIRRLQQDPTHLRQLKPIFVFTPVGLLGSDYIDKHLNENELKAFGSAAVKHYAQMLEDPEYPENLTAFRKWAISQKPKF